MLTREAGEVAGFPLETGGEAKSFADVMEFHAVGPTEGRLEARERLATARGPTLDG